MIATTMYYPSPAYYEEHPLVLVLKTNASNAYEFMIRKLLREYDEIERIDFDFEDCDNILRIECSKDVTLQVERTLKLLGLWCEPLLE